MMRTKPMILGIVSVLVAWVVFQGMKSPPLPPDVDPNPWWGPGHQGKPDTSIRPFKINIPETALEDLATRLKLPTRLTPGLESANFTYGFNGETMTSVINYWRNKYDWRKREVKLNSVPHFITQIEGLDIHFLHIKPSNTKNRNIKIIPLLMIHGWPGSFIEFMDIIPMLTTVHKDSSIVFELICPSLPGYGFSQGSSKQGLSHVETAQIFLKLMKRLGFDKFYIQGGDWGSLVATNMGTFYPNNVIGVHLNMIGGVTPYVYFKMLLGSVLPSGLIIAEEDQHKLYPLLTLQSRILRESGYLHIQASKPDTVGVGLNNSPIGLAAYILEKFSTWTHLKNMERPEGGLLHDEFPISLDALLDNVCLYWFTGSVTTSMRYYAEAFNKRVVAMKLDEIPCTVPVGLAAFPQELITLPENLASHKYTDILTYTNMPRGGHFAAMEEPRLLATDVFKFVTTNEQRTIDEI